MIVVLNLSPAQKEHLLEVLASHQDEGPPGYQWQSRQLGWLRYTVEQQIKHQQRDPE